MQIYFFLQRIIKFSKGSDSLGFAFKGNMANNISYSLMKKKLLSFFKLLSNKLTEEIRDESKEKLEIYI